MMTVESGQSSQYLTPGRLRGMLKMGDIIIPGGDGLPSFSQSGTIRDLDRVLDGLDRDDRENLLLLFGVLGVFPSPLSRLVIAMTKLHKALPTRVGAFLRFLELGVKGIFFSLYYSDKTIRGQIGYVTSIGKDLESAGSQKAIGSNSTFEKARTASLVMRKSSVSKRIQWIATLRKIILDQSESIVDAIQKDCGKSRTDAFVSEIFSVLDHLEYLEKNAVKTLADERVPTPIALLGKKSEIFYEPMGVVLIISPWNYPFAMALMPITTALAAGNAVVYKPSEHTPLEGLLERLFAEAAFPDAAFQVVYGDGKTGAALIEEKPDKIFFTGSVQTGRKIMAAAAKHLIPVELELGGKDPMIVFSDANLDRAAAGALWGAMTNSGQACTSVERLYIEESIAPELTDKIVSQALTLQSGVDADGDRDIGRMTTSFQVATVKAHLDDALAKGARQLTGTSWDGVNPMVPPIVLDMVTPDMLIASEETFGPVLPILKFKSESEVVSLANNSPYGLSASVWTADIARARRVARALVTGNVSINNVMLTEGNSALPFGGVKDSGFGRYRGRFGLYSFSNIKSILVDANSGKFEANWFPYTAEKYQRFRKMTDHLHGRGVVSFLAFVFSALRLESYANRIAKRGRP